MFHNNFIKTLQRRPSPYIRVLSLFLTQRTKINKRVLLKLACSPCKTGGDDGKDVLGKDGGHKEVPRTKGSCTGRTKARPLSLSLYMKSYMTKGRRYQQISPPKDIGLIHLKCIQFLVMDEMNPLQKVHDQTRNSDIKTESVIVAQIPMSILPSPLDLYHFSFYRFHQTLVGKWFS